MRMMAPLLLAAIACNGTALAQDAQQARAPFFEGDGLPALPAQNAPWEHQGDALSDAAATLFEQGLPDPRGLDYREIDIAVGNPWDGGGSPVRTHGWVLRAGATGGSFAIAWNGLVYPVLRSGDAADVRVDWIPFLERSTPVNGPFLETSEASSVRPGPPTPIRLALLLRLGDLELVQKTPTPLVLESATDPYLLLATDWVWFAFERATCAHARGDDRLALADARLLTRVLPLVDAEATRRGIAHEPDPLDNHYPARPLPYISFLEQLPVLLADCERRVAGPRDAAPPKNDVAALVDDLENVDARQWGQPGGVSLAQDLRMQALVKRGDDVVEPLLDAMENDSRLTRSVSFGRDFWRSRHLVSVKEAAYAALVDLLRVDFRSNDDGTSLVARIREYWRRTAALEPAERFYLTLKEDTAGPEQWLQAAANIVQPTDVESHGGWTTDPDREPGQKVELRGESLRDGRTPSVSELLLRRSDDLAAIRTGSTNDHFLFIDAGRMAIFLADWDLNAALPVLRRRLERAWHIGAKPNDTLAFNGSPAENFGTIISEMTLARSRCGDDAAFDEYAEWIRSADLRGIWLGARDMQEPLIRGAERPAVARAIDYLFNDPSSPWSNVFGKDSGAFVMDFWKSTLPMTAGARKQGLRGLGDRTPAGTMTLNPPEDWNSRGEGQIEFGVLGLGYTGSGGDPDMPDAGQSCAFRVCDVYAYFYSRYQNGPSFQLFWTKAKRDAGVAECRGWLEAAK